MAKLKNIAASFVILHVLLFLLVGIYNGFDEGYGLNQQNLQNGENVFQRLSKLNLISGIEDLSRGIQKLGKISNPADLIGGLAISASGTLSIIGGIVLFPFQIFGAITGFYEFIIPPVIEKLFSMITILTVGFILLKAKLGTNLED